MMILTQDILEYNMFTAIDFTDDDFDARYFGIDIRHHVEIYMNDWWCKFNSSPENNNYKDIRMGMITGDVSYGNPSYHDVLHMLIKLDDNGEMYTEASGAIRTNSPFRPQTQVVGSL